VGESGVIGVMFGLTLFVIAFLILWLISYWQGIAEVLVEKQKQLLFVVERVGFKLSK